MSDASMSHRACTRHVRRARRARRRAPLEGGARRAHRRADAASRARGARPPRRATASELNGDEPVLRSVEARALLDEHRPDRSRPRQRERLVEALLRSAQRPPTGRDGIPVRRDTELSAERPPELTGELEPRSAMRASVGPRQGAKLLDELASFDREPREHCRASSAQCAALVLEHPFVVGAGVDEPPDGSRGVHERTPTHAPCRSFAVASTVGARRRPRGARRIRADAHGVRRVNRAAATSA